MPTPRKAYVKADWYFSADEAIAEARHKVLEFLKENLKAGMSKDELLTYYKGFGEDPSIVGSPRVTFSAWDYADEAAARVVVGDH